MNLSPSDPIIVQSVLAGDTGMFEELVRRHQTMVLRFFQLRHSREDAMDLTQETFLCAWKSLATYSSQWKFSTWLLAVAHQQNAMFFRKRARSVESQRVDGEFEFSNFLSNRDPDPSQSLSREEEAENLWILIREKLSPDQAEVLWLFYVEESSISEIAQVMTRTVASVKTLLFRARLALQKVLKAGEP